jgi:fatty-acyl-CoA synthase
LLLAILPENVAFVAKQEVMQVSIMRTFINKLDYITVDRMDFSKSIEIKNAIEAMAREGRSFVIFPEGTFTYATGLRPFKLGAFTIAAETSTPICPISISGMRHILRGESLMPKPGHIKVHISEWIHTRGTEWSEIMRLHALARAEIAKHCGEPVIDIISATPVVD